MASATSHPIQLHGRTYARPERPSVVLCIDGFDPEYLDRGVVDGILPTFKSFLDHGFHAVAESAMPSLTNPNNVSIVTGVPVSVHGINGNYFLDRYTRKEMMILDDTLLRGSTILAEMAKAGVRVAAVTAKDKLRRILAHDLDESSICFSSEHADEEIQQWIGKPRPSQYSGDLSLFVLDAGLKILEERRADLLYLTFSDFIQHTYAPGSKESNNFLAVVDAKVKQMVDIGAVVAITGDHGMRDKCNEDGSPNILFLQDELEAKFGAGCARVICPITDPFVKHHGALGSFVRVYVGDGHMKDLEAMMQLSRGLPQVDIVMSHKEACEAYELDLNREGDFVVMSKENAVIGSRSSEHDLKGLAGHRLRSHGGPSEQRVPLLMSVPSTMQSPGKIWRNFDIFDLILNGTSPKYVEGQ